MTAAAFTSLQQYIAALDREIELCLLFNNVEGARQLLEIRHDVFVNLTGVTPRMFLALIGET